jgi:hypothetical protein
VAAGAWRIPEITLEDACGHPWPTTGTCLGQHGVVAERLGVPWLWLTHESKRAAKQRRLELIVKLKSRLRSPLYNSKSYLDATDKR